MEVVNDLLFSSDKTESSFSLSPEQERIMKLVYEEVEIAIQEGNPPFAAIITDSENNILSVAHNQANTKQFAIAHAEIKAIQLASKILGKRNLTIAFSMLTQNLAQCVRRPLLTQRLGKNRVVGCFCEIFCIFQISLLSTTARGTFRSFKFGIC